MQRITVALALAACAGWAQDLPSLELVNTFRPPCGVLAGLSLCGDGLAGLNATGDSIHVLNGTDGKLLRSVVLQDRHFDFLASSGTVVHGWCRDDNGVYRINDQTGSSERIGTNLVSSRVFAVTDTHVYVVRNEGTGSALLTRVSLADAQETSIYAARGAGGAMHQERYFWYFSTAGTANSRFELYDLSLPEDPGPGPWNWFPLTGDTGVEISCRGCVGLARQGDTLWTYSDLDTVVCRMAIRSTSVRPTTARGERTGVLPKVRALTYDLCGRAVAGSSTRRGVSLGITSDRPHGKAHLIVGTGSGAR